MSLLDKPWKVDAEGELIYAYVDGREVCIDICSGRPEDRRKVLALLAQVQEIVKAMEPLARFAAAFDAKPLRQTNDVLYGIHAGSEHEADVRLSDLRRALKALLDAGVSDGALSSEGT